MSSLIRDKPMTPIGVNSLRAIQLLSLLAIIGFVAFCAQIVLDARHDAENQTLMADSNLAQAIAQDIARSFEVYDLSLQGVLAALEEPRLSTLDPTLRKLALFDRAADARYMNRIFLLDANGNVTEDSRGGTSTDTFTDRDYFKVHRDRPDEGMYVSEPMRSRLNNNEWIMAISRRIPGPNGSFYRSGIRPSATEFRLRRCLLSPRTNLSTSSKLGPMANLRTA